MVVAVRKLIGALLMVLCSAASAEITTFGPPTGFGSFDYRINLSASIATVNSASHSDSETHWPFTISPDVANPIVIVTIDNSFSLTNGSGTVAFRSVTLSGPGMVNVPLVLTSTPGRRHFELNFAAPEGGVFDLWLTTGTNGAFARYVASVAVVPEPSTGALISVGVLALLWARKAQLRSAP
jgi:hypothetical protein